MAVAALVSGLIEGPLKWSRLLVWANVAEVATAQLSIENLFHLRVTVEGSAEQYAYYLLKGREIVERTGYSTQKDYVFPLTTSGLYRVKCFARSGASETRSFLSESIRFEGMPQEPVTPRPRTLVVYGLTANSIVAAKIFQRRHQVVGFLDPSAMHIGDEVFGIEVLGEVPDGATVVGLAGFQQNEPHLVPFELAIGANDVLSRTLNTMGAMDIYRIAHECSLLGLTRGAHFLEMFVLIKYNTRVPHQAVIGEGTRLGVGGIGIAIHPKSIVGENCVIGQNVTLGIKAGGEPPQIGDNVFIGPGAKCIGGKIGNNVVIGANAVVTKEIPDNCVVAGVPARVLRRDSNAYRRYIRDPRKIREI